jgi:hypothetical protein
MVEPKADSRHGLHTFVLPVGVEPQLVVADEPKGDMHYRFVCATETCGEHAPAFARRGDCHAAAGGSTSTGPLSHRVGVTTGLARRLVGAMEVEPDAEDERGEGDVPSA